MIKLISFVKNYYFEVFFGICLLILLIFFIYNKLSGKKGSWSNDFYYSDNLSKLTPLKKKKIKKDSSGEIECKRVLEKLFGKPFPRERPGFLHNTIAGNANLELDCYNEKLALAVEYNGQQHYNYVPFFHKNKEAFHNQKYRDDMKRRLCKEHDIILIEVPYTVRVDKIEDFLLKEIKKNDYLRQQCRY